MDTTLMRQAKQATDGRLFIAFELAQRHWRLAFSDAVGRPRLVTLEAGDQGAVKEAIAKARAHFGLDEAAVVVSCYEAGRDGFWLHRWLLECGVENLIVDSGSIEVNRRQRRAKTDRLDALKLLSMLIRYVGGERRVWTVLHVPTMEQEDGRRPHRERERLDRERLAHSNRIRGLLMLHNIRVKTIGGRKWCQRLQALRAHLPGIDDRRLGLPRLDGDVPSAANPMEYVQLANNVRSERFNGPSERQTRLGIHLRVANFQSSGNRSETDCRKCCP